MAERCVHELVVEQCVDCAPAPRGLTKFVYTTAQGQVYHRVPGCKALLEGQRYAERLGLEIHDVRRVALAVARAEGRGACSYCLWGYRPG
ncbi:hypothetical protein HEK616_00750 [Streptomyces nigrescens]|uniref:Uncharacterized protein n=1 Tax=Streptomyces nigrescens TaxID=1920 RepID=A0ABN6QNW3_STRNI|nr:hypothetical protein [Streptomyces nigrescens]BDM66588.1 hypothetical protein HEK616_00750 [Streptomyces nigrescens]